MLTLLVFTSLKPLRNEHYEVFYALHVLFVPLMLTAAAFHHPSVWWWTWCALAIWVGERLWRATRYIYINRMSSHYGREYEQLSTSSSSGYVSSSSTPLATQHPSGFAVVKRSLHTRYYPPLGFAHAEIVAGTTVRVTYVLPRDCGWAPGQYFLINMPSISRFTTHPFTSASIHEGHGRPPVLVFFIRVKNGFTRKLWNQVIHLCLSGAVCPPKETPPLDTKVPDSGVLLRMNVDGPFGSAGRVRWGSYSSAVIVVGGSGVSYGLSILEHLCRLIVQRKRRAEREEWEVMGDGITRVKFVWIVREYGNGHSFLSSSG